MYACWAGLLSHLLSCPTWFVLLFMCKIWDFYDYLTNQITNHSYIPLPRLETHTAVLYIVQLIMISNYVVSIEISIISRSISLPNSIPFYICRN